MPIVQSAAAALTGAPVKDALVVTVLSLVPRTLVAGWMGAFARNGLSMFVTDLFVRTYGVDLSEAKAPPGGFTTLQSLFTRELCDGIRPVDSDPAALVSPVDGTLSVWATSVNGRIDVVPGRSLNVADLVGEPIDGERDVAVLYLSPRDYHRVHVPCDGVVNRWRYRAGTLWPVFPAAVRRIRNLFSRNERVSVFLSHNGVEVVAVLVGAFGVGHITLAMARVVTNDGRASTAGVVSPPATVQRGDGLGVFHLGSTVVLVLPPGHWTPTLPNGAAVRMGQRVGAPRG